MKTRALNFLLLSLFIITGRAGAEEYACLRDLMPFTESGSHQRARESVEKPFVSGGKFIVFPEVSKRKLTGFYLYDGKGAYYYDSVRAGATGVPSSISTMPPQSIYQMVAQPDGLETVTLFYLPGYRATDKSSLGPIALGASLVPLAGALVLRPDKYDYVYQNPADAPEARLRDWMAKNNSGRAPASAADLDRKMVNLFSGKRKTDAELWMPLKRELRLRRDYVDSTNIDSYTFKELSRVLEGPCKAKAQ